MVDNFTSAAYAANGNGLTVKEQFRFENAAGPSLQVLPGSQVGPCSQWLALAAT
jgi:hypothetical protein